MWQRFLFGLLIIVVYPIFLGIFVTFWLLSIVLAAIYGFIVGPIHFYAQFSCLQNACCALFCPVFMPLGAVIAVIGNFGFGIYLLGLTSAGLLMTLKALWCTCN